MALVMKLEEWFYIRMEEKKKAIEIFNS